MRKKITLYDYLANDEPTARKAKAVMEGFGYKVDFWDEAGFVVCLKQFVQQQRGKGLEALAMIHPDRDLILATQETTMNFDGFSDTTPVVKETTPSIIPQPATDTPHKDYTPIILVGILASAFFLSVAVISKK